ncbi:hypothetical protein KSF78_0009670 [Schistosoma japonicum]|nr:hypothetical protein KSF78_0009670 [Schistosoma japonicum]
MQKCTYIDYIFPKGT